MFLIFLTPVHPPQKFEKITLNTFVNDQYLEKNQKWTVNFNAKKSHAKNFAIFLTANFASENLQKIHSDV